MPCRRAPTAVRHSRSHGCSVLAFACRILPALSAPLLRRGKTSTCNHKRHLGGVFFCFIFVYTLHMFGKLKSFAAKKLIEQQIKKLPPQQQAAAGQQAQMIFALMEKNPKLFEQITKEIEAEVKKGKGQQAAALAVLPKYANELRELMGDAAPQKGSGVAFKADGSVHR